MFSFFWNRAHYISKLIKYLNGFGYELYAHTVEDQIPKELYRQSKFTLKRLENRSASKVIDLLITQNHTIASFDIINLNHSRPLEQYCDPLLSTTLYKLCNEEFKYFEVFGFHKYNRKEFNETKKWIEKQRHILTTKSLWNIEKYPRKSDLCNVKSNLQEVMKKYGYSLKIDGSRYKAAFTKPELWYSDGRKFVKFKRVKSKDENFIFSIKKEDSIDKNIFSFGTCEPGRPFTDEEWLIIVEKLQKVLNKL